MSNFFGEKCVVGSFSWDGATLKILNMIKLWFYFGINFFNWVFIKENWIWKRIFFFYNNFFIIQESLLQPPIALLEILNWFSSACIPTPPSREGRRTQLWHIITVVLRNYCGFSNLEAKTNLLYLVSIRITFFTILLIILEPF